MAELQGTKNRVAGLPNQSKANFTGGIGGAGAGMAKPGIMPAQQPGTVSKLGGPSVGQAPQPGQFGSAEPDLTSVSTADVGQLQNNLAQTDVQLAELRRRIGTRAPTPEEAAQLNSLVAQQSNLQTQIDTATSPDQARIREFVQQRQFREEDLARGRARALERVGQGSLGRLEGLTEGQNQAIREQALLGLQGQQQLAQRRLRGTLASTGVQGGLAGGLQSSLLGEQASQRAQAEQALATGLIEQGIDINKFNLGQGQKELLAQLGIEFGEAGLGAAERGAVISKEAATKAAEIAANSAGGGGGKK